VWGAPAVFRGRMRGLTGANFGRIRANEPCVTPSSVYVAGERSRSRQAAGESRHVERHELASGGSEAPLLMHCLSGFGEAHRLDSTRVTLGRYHAVDGSCSWETHTSGMGPSPGSVATDVRAGRTYHPNGDPSRFLQPDIQAHAGVTLENSNPRILQGSFAAALELVTVYA
jgi:hypothetical protein